MLSPAQKIDQAWRLRFDQRNEESLALWCEAREDLGMDRKPLSENDIPKLLEQKNSDLIFESIFLQASLCRMQRQFDESNRLLGAVTNQFALMGIPLPARALIEKGLNGLAIGDFSTALEFFLTASSRASDPFQKLTSLTNIVTCLDELGLANDQALKAAQDQLAKMHDRTGVTGAEQHLHHFELRKSFRQGEFKNILIEPIDTAEINQSTYFKIWTAALPYHAFYVDPHEQLQRFANSNPHLFAKAYRLRTMQSILHPEDTQMAKPGEWADRLYLWVWKWLKDPQGFSIRRTMAAVSQWTNDPSITARLSTEDRQLVRNALLWLSLFDRQSHARLKDSLRNLSVSDAAASPLFSFESLVIYYFMALRDGDALLANDYRFGLESLPLWHSKDLYLHHLVRLAAGEIAITAIAEPLQMFGKNILQICNPAKAGHDACFMIDLTTFEIRDDRTGKSIASESIAKAAQVLSTRPTVPVAEMVSICFGISRFDSSIHNQRVFNLLWRMKQMFAPGMNFKMKSGLVIAEGDWRRFSIVGDNAASLALRSQQEWSELTTGSQSSRRLERAESSTVHLSDKPLPSVLSRKEIEEHLGKSRATMNRVLKTWEEKGWVQREGNARATRYHIGREVMKILKGAMI